MPYITPQQRAQGPHTTLRRLDPHNGGPCDCDWSDPHNWTAERMAHRTLPGPDQRRYGTATTDPLGRDGAGWHKGPSGLPVRDKGDRETTR